MRTKLVQWGMAGVAIGFGILRVSTGRGWRYCVFCKHRVPAFLPWRGGQAGAPRLMASLGMVGSDLNHFACPRCGSTDRERHLRLYIEHSGMATDLAGKRVLHFAPERHLASWIGSLAPVEHVMADIDPAHKGIRRIDLEEIPFANGHFDFVIANHVLEHVSDLNRAIAEIARVLGDGGSAVLQVPWCRGLATTIEDSAIEDPLARLQLYGQEDHVRLFGRDVFDRIGKSGLRAEPQWHADLLAHVDSATMGVNVDEPFMRFRRIEHPR